MNINFLIFIQLTSMGKSVWAFNALSVENQLLNELFPKLGIQLDRAPGESLSHEEIFRRGVKRTIIKYLNDRNSSSQINPRDSQTPFRQILTHFYGRRCKYGIEHLISNVFEPNIASVDLNESTRDDPVVHFDSEKLVESNTRVLQLTEQILELVKTDEHKESSKNLKLARQLTASTLHTIQDFYSHTNWVDVGNREINSNIGTSRFIVTNPDLDDSFCLDNCEQLKCDCPQIIASLLPGGLTCPLVYWKCTNNLNESVKSLTSGYYSNQRLSDGSRVDKPIGRGKCSHGGILDLTASSVKSFGGINKDSAYFILSPKAHLHMIAANLAIDHTESYFDMLRREMGDERFAKFMRLDPDDDLLNKICGLFGI